MAHVVRAWRTSRMIRLFVLFALLGTLTQILLSRESHLVKSETPQSKTIGSLVSIEKLPEMGGEFCETDAGNGTAGKEETLTAALEQRQDLRASSLAARPTVAAGAGDTQDRSK